MLREKNPKLSKLCKEEEELGISRMDREQTRKIIQIVTDRENK